MEDDHRLLPRWRAIDEAAEREARISTILVETGGELPKATTVGHRAAGGDRARLRGVPVSIKWVSGTSLSGLTARLSPTDEIARAA
jgi:hypothetical protein